MNLLSINSSINGEHSVSRRLVSAVVDKIVAAHSGTIIVSRDVAAESIPHITARPDPENPYLSEFLAADTIIIGTPMYNFGIPSQLKAWMDNLAVPGATFNYVDGRPVGKCGDKKVVIVSSRAGGFSEGSPFAFMDHQEKHIEAYLRFLGVTDIQIVRAEGYGSDPELTQQAFETTRASLPEFA